MYCRSTSSHPPINHVIQESYTHMGEGRNGSHRSHTVHAVRCMSPPCMDMYMHCSVGYVLSYCNCMRRRPEWPIFSRRRFYSGKDFFSFLYYSTGSVRPSMHCNHCIALHCSWALVGTLVGTRGAVRAPLCPVTSRSRGGGGDARTYNTHSQYSTA